MSNIKDSFKILNYKWGGSFKNVNIIGKQIDPDTGLEIGKINVDYHHEEQRAARSIIEYIFHNHDWSLLSETERSVQEEKLSLLYKASKENIVMISQIRSEKDYQRLFEVFFDKRKECRSHVFANGEIDYASLLKYELCISQYENINFPRIEDY